MDGCSWVPFNRSMHESSLVFAANDSDGSIITIGRAHHSGDLIPGKALTRHGKCHVSYNGQELSLANFEVLVNTGGFTWQESSNGHVPPNAIIGGKTATGEILYVGRAKHGSLTIPGKVHPSHRCIYYPCDWKEHAKTTYDVLVRLPSHSSVSGGGGGNQGWVTGPEMLPPHGGIPVFPSPPGMASQIRAGVQWKQWQAGRPWPINAVQAGAYKEGGSRNPQYIARRRHQLSTLIGYAYMNGPFYASFHGAEVSYADFEVLVDHASVFPKEHL